MFVAEKLDLLYIHGSNNIQFYEILFHVVIVSFYGFMDLLVPKTLALMFVGLLFPINFLQ